MIAYRTYVYIFQCNNFYINTIISILIQLLLYLALYAIWIMLRRHSIAHRVTLNNILHIF